MTTTKKRIVMDEKKDVDLTLYLALAIERGDNTAAKYLISTGKVDVNASYKLDEMPPGFYLSDHYGYCFLTWAALKGQKAIVELLLDSGAAVNNASMFGYSPLHAAARNGDTSIVQTLLDNGAEIDSTDSEGVTPLGEAEHYENVNITEVLISNGADPKSSKIKKNTMKIVDIR